MKEMIQVLMAALGSVGFAVLFHVRGKKLLLFFLGGALDWAVYLVATKYGANLFTGIFLATATAALASEICARVFRTPVLALLVPMLIPLVPGSDLYYTMHALIQGSHDLMAHHAGRTITTAGAIAMGIIGVAAVMHIVLRIEIHFRKPTHNTKGNAVNTEKTKLK